MLTSPHRVCLRALALGLLATAALLGLVLTLLPTLDLDLDQPYPVFLPQCCAVVLLGCAGWMWLLTALVLGEAVSTAVRTGDAPVTSLPRRRRGVPTAYRRLLVGACGLALSAGGVAPALATPGPVHVAPHPAFTARAHLGSTTTGAASPHQDADAPVPAAAASEQILVRPGDSLWRIAAQRLPREADDATITHTWRRLYTANRDVIGDDPDRLEPGQLLNRPQVW
jgi:hypothetical protein